MSEDKIFCKGGGCTAKLGPEVLDRILPLLPRKQDKDLLVGYDHADDAALYRLTENLAIVQTLDFFPPMVEDPHVFGQIAAANALSDIYAMGGTAKTALNIVCFPESMDLNILGKILTGGAEKVEEAEAVLAGGHSIQDADIKYGLSVTGVIHPDQVLANQNCHPGDMLILTKPLGVGIVCTASRMKDVREADYELAVKSMTTLNKYASALAGNYETHACPDVTGFGFLVHLNELLGENCSARIFSDAVPFIPGCPAYVEEFYITAAGQRNRNHMKGKVEFQKESFFMEELLFDPQTSGGLLLSVKKEDAEALLSEIWDMGLPAAIVGEVTEKEPLKILVE